MTRASRTRAELGFLGVALCSACLSPESSALPEALRDLVTIVAVDADRRSGFAFESSAHAHLAVPLDDALYFFGYPYPAAELQIPLGPLSAENPTRTLPEDEARRVVRRATRVGDWELITDPFPLQNMLEAFDTDSCLRSGGCLSGSGLAERCAPCGLAPVVAAPEPPRIPCSDPWVPDPALVARDLPGCHRPVVERCAEGFPFLDGCRVVIPPCEALGGPWPSGLPATGVVYLSQDEALGGDGLTAARTLQAALDRARTSSASIIAVAGHVVADPGLTAPIDFSVAIVGLCPDRSSIELTPDNALAYGLGPALEIRDLALRAMLLIQGGQALIERSRLSPGGPTNSAVSASAGAGVHIRDVELMGPGSTGIQGFTGAQLQLERLAIEGTTLSGIRCDGCDLFARDVYVGSSEQSALFLDHTTVDCERLFAEGGIEGIVSQHSRGTFRDLHIRNGTRGAPAAIRIRSSTLTIERASIEDMALAGIQIGDDHSTERSQIDLIDVRIEGIFPNPDDADNTTEGIVIFGFRTHRYPTRPVLRAERLVVLESGRALHLDAADAVEIVDALFLSTSSTLELVDLTGGSQLELTRIYLQGGASRACVYSHRADTAEPMIMFDVRAVGCNEGALLGGHGELSVDRMEISGANATGLRTETLPGGPIERKLTMRDLSVKGETAVGIAFTREAHVLERFVIDGPVIGLAFEGIALDGLSSLSVSQGHVRATSVGVTARALDPHRLRGVLDRVRVESAYTHVALVP